MIKDLTAVTGASGDEYDIREEIRKHIDIDTYEVTTDSIGNLYAVKKGSKSDKRVMITAHMDELGFMVTSITDAGMLKIKALGGFDDRVLPSKRVRVGSNKIPGVVGLKPVHLQEGDEKKQNVKMKQLFVDIGCSNREEAEKLVSLGDYVYFDSELVDMGDGIIKSKALDNRTGCGVLIEVLKEKFDFTLQGCFTVQEEVGLRGAGVAAYNLKPDIALVLEGTTCSDMPGEDEHQMVTRLGRGPAVSIIDRHSYSNRRLVGLILETAKDNNIKVQIREGVGGGNDSGKIQTSLEGVPTAMIAIPCRYIHSPSSVMSMDDFDNTVRLVKAVLRRLENEAELNLSGGKS